MNDETIRVTGLNLKKWGSIAFYLLVPVILVVVWPIVSLLTLTQLQPIASTVATISGILFGFVMGSMSFLTTASGVTLIENAKKTGYLKKLTGRLHTTMGWLLLSCVVFLVTMFIPDAVNIDFSTSQASHVYRVSSLFTMFGIGVLIIAFKHFYSSWAAFKDFADSA